MANAALGVLIEDMATRGVEGNLDGVACAGGGAGGNASDEVGTLVHDLDLTVTLLGLTDVQVQVDLSTHQLGNVNVCLEGSVGVSLDLSGLVIDALGTQTQNDLLVDVVLQSGVDKIFSK